MLTQVTLTTTPGARRLTCLCLTGEVAAWEVQEQGPTARTCSGLPSAIWWYNTTAPSERRLQRRGHSTRGGTWALPEPSRWSLCTTGVRSHQQWVVIGISVTNGSGHGEEAKLCSRLSIHLSIWVAFKEARWKYNMVLSDLYPKGWK